MKRGDCEKFQQFEDILGESFHLINNNNNNINNASKDNNNNKIKNINEMSPQSKENKSRENHSSFTKKKTVFLLNRNGIKKDNEKTKTTVKSLDNVKTFSG